MKKILLMSIGMSLILNAEFVKTADIVKDSYSNLEWQDDTIGSVNSWQGAIDSCENLTLETHTDWRLPNVNELRSIVDRNVANPAIISVFTSTISDNYWSSTTSTSASTKAWFVSFSTGILISEPKSTTAYVRCVRVGESSSI